MPAFIETRVFDREAERQRARLQPILLLNSPLVLALRVVPAVVPLLANKGQSVRDDVDRFAVLLQLRLRLISHVLALTFVRCIYPLSAWTPEFNISRPGAFRVRRSELLQKGHAGSLSETHDTTKAAPGVVSDAIMAG